MKKIDPADLLRFQKQIADKMVKVALYPCLKRLEKLVELNAQLDSLNRAAFYLKKEIA